MMIRNKSVEMGLESDQLSPIVAGPETDSEEFTFGVESFLSEISSDEETYVNAIRRDDQFETELNLKEARDDDSKNLIALLEGDKASDSSEENEFDSSESSVATEAVKSLKDPSTSQN